jgi:hypothetical protein
MMRSTPWKNLQIKLIGAIAPLSLLLASGSHAVPSAWPCITMTRIALTTNLMQHGRVQHLPEWKYLLLAKV